MNTRPDHDELRIRGQLREHIDGTPASPPARARDWLDDLWDDAPAAPSKQSVAEPAPGVVAEEPAGERRWDWSRLLHWPYARPCCGATAALLPLFHGQSPALGWGAALTNARTEAGLGGAYVLAAISLGVGALWVHRRRSWIAWSILTCAFVGTVAMGRLGDIVTFTTGATR